MDIVGRFLRATGSRRWLLVATVYFIKWVEAEPLASIKDTNVRRFVWKNIVMKYSVPRVLVLKNGLQFDSKAFGWYCTELGITNRYSTPFYPQSNGQAEATNKFIIDG